MALHVLSTLDCRHRTTVENVADSTDKLRTVEGKKCRKLRYFFYPLG
jgi:hypothetical protein